MNFKKNAVLLLLLFVLTGNIFAEKSQLTLVGWGIDEKNIDQFFADAEEVGFDVLITWSTDPVFLKKAVTLGEKYNIKIFSSLAPMEGMVSSWKKKYPDKPVPLQVMSEVENAAEKFISAGKNRSIIPFQWGGEAVMENEVLLNKIICLNNKEAKELFKPVIDGIVSVEGLEGMAFDGFGYQNYHCCRCEHCLKLVSEYMRENPKLPKEVAEVEFSRKTLVDYINSLADYARSKRKDIKTTIHIWPVFTPEPLYGNRLDLDYCGQTAAWFMPWSKEKIEKYSKIISQDAKKYYSRQAGVAMIGYYDRPGEFPVKSATCVDIELKTMIENGCNRIQVCGAKDVINNKKIAEVFKKYFK
jgi:hypothetical protein